MRHASVSLLRMAIVATGLLMVPVTPAGAAGLPQAPASGAGSNARTGVALPSAYVIGAEDVLSIIFWREKEMSADVVVRPDGRISLPLLNDINAAGFTPEELAAIVAKAASKFVADPTATVIVKEINSRKVFVVGEVATPGTVALNSDMNVLQLLARVGGLLEHADKNKITIVRTVNGREQRFMFNYGEVLAGRNPTQNITLQPGDTILVR